MNDCCCPCWPESSDLPGGRMFVGTWNELRALSSGNSVVLAGALGYCTSTRGVVRAVFVDAGGSIWEHVGSIEPTLGHVDRNHWLSWQVNDAGPESYVGINADGGSLVPTDTAEASVSRPGVLSIRITGALNSRAGPRQAFQMMRVDAATADRVFMHRTSMVFPDDLPVAGGDFEYRLQIGAADTITSAVPADGIYFAADISSANWLARTVDGGATTETDTGIPLVVTTGFDLLAEFGDIGGVPTVRFVIDGALVASHTTNIPTNAQGLLANSPWLHRTAVETGPGLGDVEARVDFSNWEQGLAA